MADLKGRYRSLQVFLDICVKCGACTDKCHYFIGTSDAKNMPVARQDLLRKVYRRYFTFAGKYFPKLVGATDLTEEVLADWYNYYHQCSQCRRCSVFCPYGIDTAEIQWQRVKFLTTLVTVKSIVTRLSVRSLRLVITSVCQARHCSTQWKVGKTFEADTGIKVRFPLDEDGAEVLLVTPVSRLLCRTAYRRLDWLRESVPRNRRDLDDEYHCVEAGNFGMFIGSYETMRRVSLRVREAAIKHKVKRFVFGECGHAWRVAYSFLNTLAGPFDFLDQRYPIPQHILEFTWSHIQAGNLQIDKTENDDKVLTFHDSCNVARGSRMGDYPGSPVRHST